MVDRSRGRRSGMICERTGVGCGDGGSATADRDLSATAEREAMDG